MLDPIIRVYVFVCVCVQVEWVATATAQAEKLKEIATYNKKAFDEMQAWKDLAEVRRALLHLLSLASR